MSVSTYHWHNFSSANELLAQVERWGPQKYRFVPLSHSSLANKYCLAVEIMNLNTVQYIYKICKCRYYKFWYLGRSRLPMQQIVQAKFTAPLNCILIRYEFLMARLYMVLKGNLLPCPMWTIRTLKGLLPSMDHVMPPKHGFVHKSNWTHWAHVMRTRDQSERFKRHHSSGLRRSDKPSSVSGQFQRWISVDRTARARVTRRNQLFRCQVLLLRWNGPRVGCSPVTSGIFRLPVQCSSSNRQCEMFIMSAWVGWVINTRRWPHLKQQ